MHPRTRSKLGKHRRFRRACASWRRSASTISTGCSWTRTACSPTRAPRRRRRFFYKVPCVSLRMTTERPETVEGGAHIVAGLDPDNIVDGGRHHRVAALEGALRARGGLRARPRSSSTASAAASPTSSDGMLAALTLGSFLASLAATGLLLWHFRWLARFARGTAQGA